MNIRTRKIIIETLLGIPPIVVPPEYYRYAMSEWKIQKFLTEGRGLGERETYKPWFTIADVPSRGKSTRASGDDRFGHRTMHFLSTNEWYKYLHLEADPTCIGIKEQYPHRDRLETIAVAIRLGIKHPEDPIYRVPIVLTTDLVAKFRVDGRTLEKAFAVKDADALENKRTIEKLQLEHTICSIYGLSWECSTNRDLRTRYGDNLERLHGYDRTLILTSAQTDLIVAIFLKYPGATASDACLECDRISGTEQGTYLAMLKFLLATRQIITDLHIKPFESQTCNAFFPMGELATRATYLQRYVGKPTRFLVPPPLAPMPGGPTSSNPYRICGYIKG
ncbi:TnsA endonuclease N-terminal domain-containing protein [Cupriavidus sp. WGlv3]|uniref:TnsA endonuclease N-terminal domain-containing protein n=1 Tax=Cupriavidus sp. WGlv3 TaxID=2919924 RepID=UPI0020915A75|nr:TnsA endonuclease N-terminal domain-containing protein [Cupriavidus sp. WGlv3]MCO4861238.1 TnsA endonuclease N-terminal domain-containing protein [Cupriavidus sp. WGlv3]